MKILQKFVIQKKESDTIMNIDEFKNIFSNCEINQDKIILESGIKDAIIFIKNNYQFNVLKEMIAIDNMENGIELIYHLFSEKNLEDTFISTTVKDETESVSDIFESAVADENEIYDLFGINFVGNKYLKRLYMPEGWIGNPLRKDYQNTDERISWND